MRLHIIVRCDFDTNLCWYKLVTSWLFIYLLAYNLLTIEGCDPNKRLPFKKRFDLCHTIITCINMLNHYLKLRNSAFKSEFSEIATMLSHIDEIKLSSMIMVCDKIVKFTNEKQRKSKPSYWNLIFLCNRSLKVYQPPIQHVHIFTELKCRIIAWPLQKEQSFVFALAYAHHQTYMNRPDSLTDINNYRMHCKTKEQGPGWTESFYRSSFTIIYYFVMFVIWTHNAPCSLIRNERFLIAHKEYTVKHGFFCMNISSKRIPYGQAVTHVLQCTSYGRHFLIR